MCYESGTFKTDLVATPNERTTCDVEEAHIFRHLLPSVELGGLNITVDFHMPFGWSHVLTKRDDIDINLSKFYSLNQ